MIDQDPETTYQDIRRGAEVHRLVRKHARKAHTTRNEHDRDCEQH